MLVSQSNGTKLIFLAVRLNIPFGISQTLLVILNTPAALTVVRLDENWTQLRNPGGKPDAVCEKPANWRFCFPAWKWAEAWSQNCTGTAGQQCSYPGAAAETIKHLEKQDSWIPYGRNSSLNVLRQGEYSRPPSDHLLRQSFSVWLKITLTLEHRFSRGKTDLRVFCRLNKTFPWTKTECVLIRCKSRVRYLYQTIISYGAVYVYYRHFILILFRCVFHYCCYNLQGWKSWYGHLFITLLQQITKLTATITAGIIWRVYVRSLRFYKSIKGQRLEKDTGQFENVITGTNTTNWFQYWYWKLVELPTLPLTTPFLMKKNVQSTDWRKKTKWTKT